MILLQQLVILFALLACGVSASAFLFWVLFKKDAPSFDDVKETFMLD